MGKEKFLSYLDKKQIEINLSSSLSCNILKFFYDKNNYNLGLNLSICYNTHKFNIKGSIKWQNKKISRKEILDKIMSKQIRK